MEAGGRGVGWGYGTEYSPTGLFSRRPNWDPLTRRRVCPLTLWLRRGNTLACGRGGGDRHCGTLGMYVLFGDRVIVYMWYCYWGCNLLYVHKSNRGSTFPASPIRIERTNTKYKVIRLDSRSQRISSSFMADLSSAVCLQITFCQLWAYILHLFPRRLVGGWW